MAYCGLSGIKELDKAVSGEIVTSCEAYENLRVLCDEGGGRFAGSAGEVRAREFMVKKLAEYGLENVHTEEYSYCGWLRGAASLEVSLPSAGHIPCFSLPHSPAGEALAEMVFVGAGGSREFETAGDLAGKIVLVTNESPKDLGRWLHRSEKYGRAMKAGAAGFVYMRMGPMLAETGTVRHNETGRIPAVSITRESGMALRRLLEKGPVRIRITTTDQSAPMMGRNIVGEIPGMSDPGKVLLVGAHIDGHDISQAAADNGGGSAVILEAARALAKHKEMLPKTVRFVWFTGEEIGLLGSNSYANRHANEAENIEFMLNCDVAGGGGVPSVDTMGSKEAEARFALMSKELNLPLRVSCDVEAYSDVYPFHTLGVPGISFYSSAPDGSWNFTHTSADTFDKMNPWGLMLDSLAVTRLMAHLCWANPLRRITPDEIAASIAGLREAFEMEGRLPNGASRGL